LAAPVAPPSFGQYPFTGPKFSGKPAAPMLRTTYQRTFRAAIRNSAARGPNFAGRYTIAEWGCGAGCVSIVIVDAANGAVRPGPFRNLGWGDGWLSQTFHAPRPKHPRMARKIQSTLLIKLRM
jgi:hypothetical protein